MFSTKSNNLRLVKSITDGCVIASDPYREVKKFSMTLGNGAFLIDYNISLTIKDKVNCGICIESILKEQSLAQCLLIQNILKNCP